MATGRVMLTMPERVARELGSLLLHATSGVILQGMVNAKLTGSFSTVNYEEGEVKIAFFSEEVKSSFWRDDSVEG